MEERSNVNPQSEGAKKALIKRRSTVEQAFWFDGKPLKLSSKQRKFLRTFETTVSIEEAAAAAGIHRTMHHYWRRHDEDYQRAWEQLWQDEMPEYAEHSAYRRAFKGYQEPLSYKGQLTYETTDDGLKKPVTITKYSDQLAAKMLAGLKPEKYKESAINVNTSGPVAVQIVQPSVSQPPVPTVPQRASQSTLPADPVPPVPIYEQDSPEHVGDVIARFRPGYK